MSFPSVICGKGLYLQIQKAGTEGETSLYACFFCFQTFRIERINEIDRNAVITIEIRSAIGAAYRIDSTPAHATGRIKISGTKQKTSRIVEETIA